MASRGRSEKSLQGRRRRWGGSPTGRLRHGWAERQARLTAASSAAASPRRKGRGRHEALAPPQTLYAPSVLSGAKSEVVDSRWQQCDMRVRALHSGPPPLCFGWTAAAVWRCSAFARGGSHRARCCGCGSGGFEPGSHIGSRRQRHVPRQRRRLWPSTKGGSAPCDGCLDEKRGEKGGLRSLLPAHMAATVACRRCS
jgi:hypothetical protein